MQTLIRWPNPPPPPCNRVHLHLRARSRSRSPCQSLVDYGNAETPSMHRRFGSGTLSQPAFPVEGHPNFPREKFHWDNTAVASTSKAKKKRRSVFRLYHLPLGILVPKSGQGISNLREKSINARSAEEGETGTEESHLHRR